MSKKISVVITSYNQCEYLKEVIESVSNQTVKLHEIIIADDHSTDGSVELIRDYMARYPGWIKGVFQQANVGIPRNRNTALHLITGEYVGILDGDDLFLPYKVEKEIEELEKNPEVRCIYSNVNFIDAKGNLIEVRDKMPQPSGNIFVNIAMGMFGLLRSMIINYELLKEVGFMDERFPKYDGYDLTLQLAKRCEIGYIHEPLVSYRVHASSDSRGLTAKQHLHDLEGIYNKTIPLMADLSPDQKAEIEKRHAERITYYKVFF